MMPITVAGLAREGVALADHRRIGVEPALPQPVAEDDDAVVVLIGGQPPVQGLRAQRREERRRRLGQEELVDLPFRARRGRTGAVEPDVLESRERSRGTRSTARPATPNSAG